MGGPDVFGFKVIGTQLAVIPTKAGIQRLFLQGTGRADRNKSV